MASLLSPFFLVLTALSFFIAASGGGGGGGRLGLGLHHRFSPPVRRWVESRGRDLPGGWPEKGTVEYYAALAGHDGGRALNGGGGGAAPAVTFSEGNATIKVSSLGL